MITFSEDPKVAEEQMRAVVLYLVGLGYVDQSFDHDEKQFIRAYCGQLVEHRVRTARVPVAPELAAELIAKYTAHFHEVIEQTDASIQALFTAAVARDEDINKFVYSRIKLKCYEVFSGLDDASRAHLLQTVDEFIAADGVVHSNEAQLRRELGELLAAPIPIEEGELEVVTPAAIQITAPELPAPRLDDHPFLQRLEQHYSRDPAVLREQAAADYRLMQKVAEKLDEMRATGNGRLAGHASVADLPDGTAFLDGHVFVGMAPPDRETELLVLGDLHGCYSCLKAALLQADFFGKVQAYKDDPVKNPDVKLVLLGDYIDRGMYSYNGVLRTLLQVFLTAPEHVYMLRGNHEYYIEYKGKVYGGVQPAEAILTHEPYMPQEMFEQYMRLFEMLPNTLLFNQLLFTHAGIPRDDTIAEKWKDLSSLNDADVRFQMMWSDPSQADFVPRELQKESARFAFGRLQFRSFMARVGANVLVRGHTKIDEGFKTVIDDGVVLLMNLFSAGGASNDDLPPDSSYRTVTPMALTMRVRGESAVVTPWKINYEKYNSPERNAFFKVRPEIEFRGH